jgi:hypothetical protein
VAGSADAGAGADACVLGLAVIDAVTGADAGGAVAAVYALADTGAGADTRIDFAVALAANDDSGAGADAGGILAVAVPVIDGGTAGEAVCIAFGAADAGEGDEIASYAFGYAGSDGGAGADAGPLAVAHTGIEHVPVQEIAGIVAADLRADAGSGGDAAVLHLGRNDGGSGGAESLVLTVVLPVADGGVAGETPSVMVTIDDDDTGAGGDVSLGITYNYSSTDTGTGSDVRATPVGSTVRVARSADAVQTVVPG